MTGFADRYAKCSVYLVCESCTYRKKWAPMESSDPLSIAVNVACGFFDSEAEVAPHWWWELTIFRMLAGDGWMVTAKRTSSSLTTRSEKAVAASPSSTT